MNKCPACSFSHTQPITSDEKRMFCPKCKHTWVVGKEEESLKKESAGSLNFSGATDAQKLLNLIKDNLNMPAEMKPAIMAQMTSAFFEQWYEGFKAGLLADIVHKKELYDDNGKNGNEHRASDRKPGTRTGKAGQQSNKDSRPVNGEGENGAPYSRVKEQVAGVTIIRPKNLIPTEEQYTLIASNISFWKNNKDQVEIDHVKFDGQGLDVRFKIS